MKVLSFFELQERENCEAAQVEGGGFSTSAEEGKLCPCRLASRVVVVVVVVSCATSRTIDGQESFLEWEGVPDGTSYSRQIEGPRHS